MLIVVVDYTRKSSDLVPVRENQATLSQFDFFLKKISLFHSLAFPIEKFARNYSHKWKDPLADTLYVRSAQLQPGILTAPPHRSGTQLSVGSHQATR